LDARNIITPLLLEDKVQPGTCRRFGNQDHQNAEATPSLFVEFR
jgi:hypothetical protein